MTSFEHADYILAFIDIYKKHEMSTAAVRELECLAMRLPYILASIEKNDLFAGRYRKLAVGFAPQESNSLDYFIDRDIYNEVYQQVGEDIRTRLDDAVSYYQEVITNQKVCDGYTDGIAQVLDSDDFLGQPGVAFPLYRLGGLHLDYEKLVSFGIPGLAQELKNKISEGGESKAFFEAMLAALELLTEACRQYQREALVAGRDDIAETLQNIEKQAPRTFREGLQLIHLYAILSGSFNYGRMDVSLGDLLAEDDTCAIEYLCSFYELMNTRECIWDGRVIIGGMGRRNEKNADKFALLAMKAALKNRDLLPQLSMRFYDGQNPALLEQAFDNFAEGCVYPMLYKDEVNILAVQKAFGVDKETALEYLPFGCGEYVLNHQSVGTPSGVINLLKALEITLFGGYDLIDGRQMGETLTYATFDELFEAYQKNVERYVDALAWQEAHEYKTAAKTAPHLLISLLFDDCVKRGKPVFDGGVRHLGGTLESYGNTNTADSLTAIKELVYDKQILTIEQLKKMLKANFEGYENERQLLIDCAKYGNDDDAADSMAIKVHEHVCKYTAAQAKKVGLDSYLIVVINNNANTSLGAHTGASADGRLAREPMANANNPAGGMDKSGVTAFLNSLQKLDNTIHAGAVQNMKFTKTMFVKYRDQMKALLNAYFQKGQQAMLTILDRGCLEDAVINPDKYPNLIVRVGGFCARFVELDKKTQEEIVSRMLYGNDF